MSPGAAEANAGVAFENPYHDGAVITLWETGYSAAEIDALLARVMKAGARWIEVPIFGCQSDIRSADVGVCEVAARAQPLLIIRRAVAAGLGVSVLPIIETPTWDWRGLFDPVDADAWFKSYTAWLIQLAQDVRDTGAAELIVGSEFKILYNKYGARWTQLIHDLRPVFSGPLIITANWDQLAYPFWADSDAIGISVYFPLALASDPAPTQAGLNAAWARTKSSLLKLAKKAGRPLYFTEVGYNSTQAAAVSPWGWTASDQTDLSLQASCFAAMQSAWASEKKLVRANVWGISDPDQDSAGKPTFDFLNSPAEAVLNAFFAARAALGG